MSRRAPRKISLAAAARNGQTWLTILCQTPRKAPLGYGGSVNWCGHRVEMHVDQAIAKWGAETSLSELPIFCSVCGGRDYDARTTWPPDAKPEGTVR